MINLDVINILKLRELFIMKEKNNLPGQSFTKSLL